MLEQVKVAEKHPCPCSAELGMLFGTVAMPSHLILLAPLSKAPPALGMANSTETSSNQICSLVLSCANSFFLCVFFFLFVSLYTFFVIGVIN